VGGRVGRGFRNPREHMYRDTKLSRVENPIKSFSSAFLKMIIIIVLL
jgi:hypothetical protein